MLRRLSSHLFKKGMGAATFSLIFCQAKCLRRLRLFKFVRRGVTVPAHIHWQVAGSVESQAGHGALLRWKSLHVVGCGDVHKGIQSD